MICQDTLKVPVRLVKKNPACECDYYVCDVCAHTYIDHCKKNNRPIKCIICKECYIGDVIYDPGTGKKKHAYYIKDYPYAFKLDETHSDKINCQHCNLWTGSRIEFIMVHEYECDYILTSCQYCNTSSYRKDIGEHESVCPARIINCEFCKTSIRFTEIDNHINTVCPEYKVYCKWCNEMVKRSTFTSHTQTCKEDFPTNIWRILEGRKPISPIDPDEL